MCVSPLHLSRLLSPHLTGTHTQPTSPTTACCHGCWHRLGLPQSPGPPGRPSPLSSLRVAHQPCCELSTPLPLRGTPLVFTETQHGTTRRAGFGLLRPESKAQPWRYLSGTHCADSLSFLTCRVGVAPTPRGVAVRTDGDPACWALVQARLQGSAGPLRQAGGLSQ